MAPIHHAIIMEMNKALRVPDRREYPRMGCFLPCSVVRYCVRNAMGDRNRE